MTDNIYLFIPNIIGLKIYKNNNFDECLQTQVQKDYARVVFAFTSFYYMPFDPVKASAFYLFSVFLDELDGYFARILNQCSNLGAMLDQLIDRITNMCLCATLCHLYPKYILLFQFAMALDICSHWMYMQSTAQKGSSSHKNIDLGSNPILRHYYHNRVILSTLCAANELFFCMLYLNHFTAGPIILGIGLWKLLCILCAPLAIIKMLINIVQLGAGVENYAIMDREDRGMAAASQKKLG